MAPTRYELSVTQVIKPLVASLGATYGSPASGMRAPSAPTARAAPTPRSPQPIARSVTPPNVIVPDDLLAVSDAPAAKKRLPLVPAALIAAVVIAGGAIFAGSRSRESAPDASQDPPTSVILPPAAPAPAPAPAAASAPAAVARIDSGAISIGALPKGTRVTLNGKVVSDRYLALPPGRYQLAASTPGHKTVSQSFDVRANQTVDWIPELSTKKGKVSAPKAHAPETARSTPTARELLQRVQ